MLCFCFGFLRLLCPVLSVSLDCPFLIAPSVFSNVYFSNSFQCYFLSRPRLYCYRFLPNTLREPGTSKSYRVENDDNVTNVHVFKQNQNGTMKNVIIDALSIDCRNIFRLCRKDYKRWIFI